jgi:hypothetical protein
MLGAGAEQLLMWKKATVIFLDDAPPVTLDESPKGSQLWGKDPELQA